MNTYKVIEKPSGLFGITFEDAAILVGVMFLTLFPLNVLKIWFKLPSWLTLFSYALIVVTYIVLRRVNKMKMPGYLFSFLAWKLVTPRHIYIDKELEFLKPDDAVTKEKKKR